MKKLSLNKITILKLQNFIEKYDESSLLEALKDYEISHHIYLLKNKTGIIRIPVSTINYIKIHGHHIYFHTTMGIFSKYGTLKNEYKKFKTMGFVKCSQSVLIPTTKIKEIKEKNVILTTNDEIPLSRNYASSVISAYILSTHNN